MNFHTLWQFSRPHTVIGTTISVISLLVLAWGSYPNNFSVVDVLPPLLETWLACILANVAIVGLNQIIDLEIDRINKPQLPLPAGLLSVNQAWIIVGVCAVVALAIAITSSIYLSLTVVISLIIGTCYSLPPIRLKKYAFWSAFCIVAVRGAVVNIGLFWHFSRGAMPTPLVWLLTGFMLIFGIIIAITKDLVDVKGDQQFGINTLSVTWGKEQVFWRSQQLLFYLYLLTGILAFPLISASPLGIILVSCCAWISLAVSQVDINSNQEIAKFYRFIWQLFYLSYLFFPLGLLHLAQISSPVSFLHIFSVALSYSFYLNY